jgi:hypothetical protein
VTGFGSRCRPSCRGFRQSAADGDELDFLGFLAIERCHLLIGQNNVLFPTQANLQGVFTASVTVVRALLCRGRTCEMAGWTVEHYKLVQESHETARDATRQIAERSIALKKPAFLLVNNLLQSNAPSTIEAVVETAMRAYEICKDRLDNVQATLGQYFQKDGATDSDAPAQSDGAAK